MANRNRNSTIWKDPFYRALPPLYKCLWDYINDDCDNAGVWIPDFKVASICIGRKVKPEIALELFRDKIQVLEEGQWLMPAFISERLCFSDLKPSDRFQKSIIELLTKHKLIFNKGLASPLQGAIRNTEVKVNTEAEVKEGVQGENSKIEIGQKNGHHITIKPKYLHDRPIVIHDLQEYFRTTHQLEDIQRAGWVNFAGFMKNNPAMIFSDASHLYNAFKKFNLTPHDTRKNTRSAELIDDEKPLTGKW
jgi:hypothetical protein